MTFDELRAACYARLKTGWADANPSIPVEYENHSTIDLNSRRQPFMTCEVQFNTSHQINLSDAPWVRFDGSLWISGWAKQGTGTANLMVPLGLISTLFKTKQFGSGVNTTVPKLLPSRVIDGWHVLSLRIPFWFDQAP